MTAQGRLPFVINVLRISSAGLRSPVISKSPSDSPGVQPYGNDDSRLALVLPVPRQGLLTAVIGVAVGIAGAIGLTRTFQSFLFGLSPTDPLTFAAVVLLLILVVLLACYIPARRASKVDPMTALRCE